VNVAAGRDQAHSLIYSAPQAVIMREIDPGRGRGTSSIPGKIYQAQ
jgi:hypothetical protein